jgi:hypothetical protein
MAILTAIQASALALLFTLSLDAAIVFSRAGADFTRHFTLGRISDT